MSKVAALEKKLALACRDLEQANTEIDSQKVKYQQLENRFRDKDGILLALSKHSLDLTFILDENCRFSYVSPSICSLTGYRAEEIINADQGGFFHIDDLDKIRDALKQAIATPDKAIPIPDLRVRHRDFRWLYFGGSAANMRDVAGVDGVVFNCHDVTERKEQEKTIYHQANYDTLTNLPNRFLFLDLLSQALLRASREKYQVGVLFIDLDDFKKVNDTLGHSAGDELLNIVAKRLTDCVRQDDTVSRLGGDEFTVILPNIGDSTDVEIVAAKIIAKIKQATTLDGSEVFISSSIGITLFPDDAGDGETLVKHADIAMYEAKDAGRSTYRFFSPEMNRAAAEWMTMETELRVAINREEFDMRYQPIVDLKSGNVTGAEALIRWNHPDRGLVSPDYFISFAEEQGMIVTIGEWVMKAACDQVNRWRSEGYEDLKMAVNVSPRQCHEPGFDAMVERVLGEARISSENFTLEITEGMFIEDARAGSVEALQNCRIRGALLSLDDFGTGYSSLSYLKRFPVDVVKIDRVFVTDIASSSEDKALCQAIIAMAHAFDLMVVGEGIETKEQADILTEFGCNRGQGYLISKPLTADQFSDFLVSWHGMPS